MLLFTDRFSRRAGMFAVFTAEGTADVLVNKYITLWGCLTTLLSANRLQIFSKLYHAVYRLLGVRKIAARYYCHVNGNGGVERINHTMA